MKKRDKLLQIIRKYKFKSVYTQLVVLITTLTAVLTAVSVVTLSFLREKMIEQERKIQEINMNYTIDQLDTVISSSYQAITSIIGDYDMIMRLNDYDRNIEGYAEDKSIKDIISKLYLVYTSDESIKNIFIIQEKYDYVIDQNGITDQEIYFNNRFKEYAAEWKENTEKQNNFTLYLNGDGRVYVLHSVCYKNSKFATLFMEVGIESLYGKETFREFLKDRIVCITDANNEIRGYLSETCDNELVSKVIENEFIKDYLVLEGSTFAKELNVIALTPMETVTGEVTVWYVIVFVIYFLGVIISVAVAIYIIGRIYRPLYGIVDLIATAGNQRGTNEFEIIEYNVNAILEHNEIMSEVMVRSTPMILEAMFRRQIVERDIDKDFEEMLNILSIEVRDGYYMVVVIYAEQKREDMDEIFSAFFNASIISVFKRNMNEYVLILYLQYQTMRKEILQQCNKLLEYIVAVMAAGRAYSDIYSIGKSYHDAIQTLNWRSVSDKETEVFDACSDQNYVCYELSGDMENYLYNQVVAGNASKVKETIEKSFHKNQENKISFKEYLKLIDVYEAYLKRICKKMDASVGVEINRTFPEVVYSVRALQPRIEVLLENYILVTNFYKDELQSDNLDKILQFIEENMERDIGLIDVADAVNLTPNYITKYFKNKTNMNFKAYLTMKRIEKARDLLENTDLAVKEIAEKCGYNSSKQLIENFTKIVGITPVEYRKHCFCEED